MTSSPTAGPVSVVIPTMGRSTLRRSIESAKNQGPALVREIIVVDNSDAPLRLSDEFLEYDVPVTVVRAPARCGVARARNRGAEHCSGEVIAFLDDDDWWDDFYLERCYAAVQDRGAALCVGAISVHRPDGTSEMMAPPDCVPKESWATWIGREMCAYGSNIVVRRKDFFDVGQFDQGVSPFEDKDFVLRVARSGGIVVGEPLAVLNLDRSDGRDALTDARSKMRGGHIRFLWKYRGVRGYIATARGVGGLLLR